MSTGDMPTWPFAAVASHEDGDPHHGIHQAVPAQSADDTFLRGYSAGYAAAMRQDQPAPRIESGDLVLVTRGPKAGMTGYAVWTEYAGQPQLRFLHYGSKELWYVPEGGLQRIFP